MNPMHVKVKRIDPKPGQLTINTVALSVGYDKGRGVVLSAYPADAHGGGIGLIITAGEYAVIDPDMKRLNRNKVDACKSLVALNVQMKEGAAWALIEKLCSKHGLAIEA
jgi:hypothetical protein